MTAIRFYHLELQTLDQVLPALLGKALQNGHRIIVKTDNASETERLNSHLWTHNPNSFLPHGSAKDGAAADQPIWLTAENDNPNAADVLILTNGVNHEDLNSFTLICDMIDGQNPQSVDAARGRWKAYKDQGFEVTYWQQSQNGGWDKKSG